MERKSRVLAELSAVGPPFAEEQPLPADPDFSLRVEAEVRQAGLATQCAVLLQMLQGCSEPSEQTRALLQAWHAGRRELEPGTCPAWMAELARWLLQPAR